LVALGARTELSLRQRLFETAEARVSHEGGWSSALRRFADYLAAGRQEWQQRSSS
jgi:hypothetical protein